MSVKLDEIQLSCPVDHLSLSITPSIHLNLPSSRLASLPHEDLLAALTSGNIWTTRGRACRLDLRILCNGDSIEMQGKSQVLESLGNHLRDAHLWSQLSLSVLLKSTSRYQLNDSDSDISLHINNHRSSSSGRRPLPRGWVLDNVDVIPPECVPCVEIHRLQLDLNFSTEQSENHWHGIKRVKSDPPKSNADDLILFDISLDPDICLDTQKYTSVIPTQKSFIFNSLSTSENTTSSESTMILPDKVHAETTRFVPFSKHVTQKLEIWFETHLINTYPTKHEKIRLAIDTGLKTEQVMSWLWSRRRRSNTLKVSKFDDGDNDDLLLQHDQAYVDRLDMISDEDEMLFYNNCQLGALVERPGIEDGFLSYLSGGLANHVGGSETPVRTEFIEELRDDMLLSQLIDTPPLLSSQSSTLSIESEAASISSCKRSDRGEFLNGNEASRLPGLNSRTVCALASTGILALLGGRGPQKHSNNVMNSTLPTNTLTQIAPALFSPGYKELMAHCAKFLPTISNAVSFSWPGNVQSPCLRMKLIQISEMDISDPGVNSGDSDAEADSSQRLNQVVKARIWCMMQRTLFDANAARKLTWADSAEENRPFVEDEHIDLLQATELREKEHEMLADEEDRLSDSFIDEEEEHLLGTLWDRDSDKLEGDDLLDYFELERRLVEATTDDMLIEDYVEEDIVMEDLLLDVFSCSNEYMLV